jgi:hypothetical protein
MTAELPAVLRKYRSNGMVLPSNLLVLLFVGLMDPNRERSLKRTGNQRFSESDFSLLQKITTAFKQIVTIPHILTETTNYICELNREVRQSALQITAEDVQHFKERRTETKNLVRTDLFFRFGLTDTAVLDLPPRKYLDLSVDAALVIDLKRKGVEAMNFNHLRQPSWRS